MEWKIVKTKVSGCKTRIKHPMHPLHRQLTAFLSLIRARARWDAGTLARRAAAADEVIMYARNVNENYTATGRFILRPWAPRPTQRERSGLSIARTQLRCSWRAASHFPRPTLRLTKFTRSLSSPTDERCRRHTASAFMAAMCARRDSWRHVIDNCFSHSHEQIANWYSAWQQVFLYILLQSTDV